MNAGGVDEACKSNGPYSNIESVADEVVISRYEPQSQGYLIER